MKKSELVDAIAERTGSSKADADKALSAVIDVVSEAVAGGDKVTLPGFGTFEKRERSAREGRNPQTGATVKIAATSVPAFKAGAAFKKQVAEGK